MKTFILTAFFGPALLLAGCSAKDCDETNNRSFTGESAGNDNEEMRNNIGRENNSTGTGTYEQSTNGDHTSVTKNGQVYRTDANIGKKNAISNHSTVTNNHLTHRDLVKKNLDSTGNYSDVGPTYNNQNGH